MKYLNYFESFSDFIKENQLIRMLRGEEYERLFDESPDEITKNELKIITKMISENTLPREISIKLEKRLQSDKIKSSIKVVFTNKEELSPGDSIWFVFFKFEDDWWLIEELRNSIVPSFKYWIADSHDGLRKWLKSF
jgi:hypothetical protein